MTESVEKTLLQPVPPTLPPAYSTPEREALQRSVRDFAAREVMPLANRLDPQKELIPPQLIKKMADQGYFSVTVPKDLGGLGLGVLEYMIVSEELGRAWMSAASIIARGQGNLGVNVADPVRREELIRRSVRGEWIGAGALSEPGAGSDLAGGVATTAVVDGDDFVINGRKRWAGHAFEGNFIEVLCRLEPAADGGSGSGELGSILIEKEPNSFPPGITGKLIDKIGYFGLRTYELEFTDFRVPTANRVYTMPVGAKASGASTNAGGFTGVEALLNTARVQTAARAVGLARGAVEDCTIYLQEREQFGRPIGDFQALRFILADMSAKVDQARAFYLQVADMIDKGIPVNREAAAVKLLASEMAVEVTGNGIQLHGGNGYTTERQVERYWRDARLTTIFEGTSQIMQKIISDRLLPRAARR